MKAKERIKELMQEDEIVSLNIGSIEKKKDPKHFPRRQQQRAISEEMVQICIHYGRRKRIHGALTFTLTDRVLRCTHYQKMTPELRGLRVVCLEENGELKILTSYWCDRITKSKRTGTPLPFKTRQGFDQLEAA